MARPMRAISREENSVRVFQPSLLFMFITYAYALLRMRGVNSTVANILASRGWQWLRKYSYFASLGQVSGHMQIPY